MDNQTYTCAVCRQAAPDLKTVFTIAGYKHICSKCLGSAVLAAIAEQEEMRRIFCTGCPQSTANGGCLQGVTPETCA